MGVSAPLSRQLITWFPHLLGWALVPKAWIVYFPYRCFCDALKWKLLY